MEKITENNAKDFLSAKFAVLDFWATWCGPCKMLAPVLEGVAEKYSENVSFGSVNVDDEEALAVQYGISVIPTLLFFKDGVQVAKSVGLKKTEDLEKIIEEMIKE